MTLALVEAEDQLSSLLVSDRQETEIRRFLRRQGFMPARKNFVDRLPADFNHGRQVFYQLAGDAHLVARTRIPLRLQEKDLDDCAEGKLTLQHLFSLKFKPKTFTSGKIIVRKKRASQSKEARAAAAAARRLREAAAISAHVAIATVRVVEGKVWWTYNRQWNGSFQISRRSIRDHEVEFE